MSQLLGSLVGVVWRVVRYGRKRRRIHNTQLKIPYAFFWMFGLVCFYAISFMAYPFIYKLMIVGCQSVSQPCKAKQADRERMYLHSSLTACIRKCINNVCYAFWFPEMSAQFNGQFHSNRSTTPGILWYVYCITSGIDSHFKMQ